jgi:hypothetical protein
VRNLYWESGRATGIWARGDWALSPPKSAPSRSTTVSAAHNCLGPHLVPRVRRSHTLTALDGLVRSSSSDVAGAQHRLRWRRLPNTRPTRRRGAIRYASSSLRSSPWATSSRCFGKAAPEDKAEVCTRLGLHPSRRVVAVESHVSENMGKRFVSERGLEPLCPMRAPGPQPGASTNSATPTKVVILPPGNRGHPRPLGHRCAERGVTEPECDTHEAGADQGVLDLSPQREDSAGADRRAQGVESGRVGPA